MNRGIQWDSVKYQLKTIISYKISLLLFFTKVTFSCNYIYTLYHPKGNGDGNIYNKILHIMLSENSQGEALYKLVEIFLDIKEKVNSE